MLLQYDAENSTINVKGVPVLKDYPVEEQANGQINASTTVSKKGEALLQQSRSRHKDKGRISPLSEIEPLHPAIPSHLNA
jgi:hypothetical protein